METHYSAYLNIHAGGPSTAGHPDPHWSTGQPSPSCETNKLNIS